MFRNLVESFGLGKVVLAKVSGGEVCMKPVWLMNHYGEIFFLGVSEKDSFPLIRRRQRKPKFPLCTASCFLPMNKFV